MLVSLREFKANKPYQKITNHPNKPDKMGLFKEPKEIDFTIHSESWTEEELSDFRKLMAEQKAKRNKAATKKEKKPDVNV